MQKIHPYETLLEVPRVVTGQTAFSYWAPVSWNKVQATLRLDLSLEGLRYYILVTS